MLNIFISMPLSGSNFSEIINKRDSILEAFKKEHETYATEIKVIESLFDDYKEGDSNPIEFLGRSISAMKDADVAIFPLTLHSSKGCKCEYKVARTYGIPVIYYGFAKSTVFFLADIDSLILKGDL